MEKNVLWTIPISIILSGCTQIVTAPVSVAGTVVSTTVDIAGAAVGAAVDVATDDDDDKEKQKT